jgi:hypothetical protein
VVIFAPKGIVGLWNGWLSRVAKRETVESAPRQLTLQAEP